MRLFLLPLILAACMHLEARLTPDQSLNRLMAGNQRYVQDKMLNPDRTQQQRTSTMSSQEPFATVLGCSDSRVPPEVIFDQGIGDIFVVRVAGNVAGPLELESIGFSVLSLNSPLILVLGHENCGAIKATIEGHAKAIPDTAALIEAELIGTDDVKKGALQKAIKDNALAVAAMLKRQPNMANSIQKGELMVRAGYYHLESGKVELLGE